MKIETLKKSHLKRNIIIGIITVVVISTLILNFTRAKYRVTESIPLVNGTINYSLPDLNIIGLYIDGEKATELDNTKQYTLDTEQSTCTYKDGSTIENLSINYESETRSLSITPFTTKGTKCTLYFNEQVFASDTILANYPNVLTRSDFSTVVTNTTTGTIHYADTSKGRTYYFAGNPTDNWVQFGEFYWRIIRINEDGSIRMIYNGTSTSTTGTGTQIRTSAFNSGYNDNMYVGYMYQSGQVHGLNTSSTIKGILDTWYQNNLTGVTEKIDGNAGFCGDRTPSTSSSTSNGKGGTGTTQTYYAVYIRLDINNSPTFECSDSSDLYTTSGSINGNRALIYPIGLITADEIVYAGGVVRTADEIVYAGGVVRTANQNYYLYTDCMYWTMSPSYFDTNGHAYVFSMDYNGNPGSSGVNGGVPGVRPVINLRSDVTISSGDGTSTNPYGIN